MFNMKRSRPAFVRKFAVLAVTISPLFQLALSGNVSTASEAAPQKPSAAALPTLTATFHVSPKGNDANPGDPQRPFATIEKARQAVRALNAHMTGDIVVAIHGGTYTVDRTIVFDAADSGTGGHNVIYRAASGEMPVISGGKRVTNWQPDAKGRWKAPAPVENFRQLYVNGVRATRARGEMPANLALSGDDGYTTTAVEMAGWKNPGDLEFCYICAWDHTRCKVQSIEREGDKAVIAMLQPYFTLAKSKEGVNVAGFVDRSYIENALELLDEPGEWYLDGAAKTVYYMPLPGEDMSKVEVIAPFLERLVELRGTLDRPVQNIHFQGITFEHGNWLRPSEIGHCDVQANFIMDSRRPIRRQGGLFVAHHEYLKSPSNVVCHAAHAIRFDRCTFSKLGGAGIDLEYGAQDNAIVGCSFHDISGTAVQIGDVLKDDHHPDDPRKIVRDNTVENCSIHDCCADYMGGVGIFAGYTEGTKILHNEITGLPYSGISVGWGWGELDAGGGPQTPTYYMPSRFDTPTPAKNNRIEYNHIHHVMEKTLDGAGIYTLGNMPGTIIRGNRIHDNTNVEKEGRGPVCGIYLDEGSGFIDVTGNLVYNVSKPINYNNLAQDRKATCNEHDNFFGAKPDDAKPIVEKAGLEAEYRDLMRGGGKRQ